MAYVHADLEAIFVQKQEAALRGVASAGHNMYEQFGGFKGVVDMYYRPIALEFILPVATWSDVVLHKAGVDADGVPQHHLTRIEWHDGRWAAQQASTCIEELPALVVGGGQAGLCASYYLQQVREHATHLHPHLAPAPPTLTSHPHPAGWRRPRGAREARCWCHVAARALGLLPARH